MARKAVRRGCVDDRLGNRAADPRDQSLAQGAQAGLVLSLVLDGGLDRGSEADDGRGVDGARADVTFLPATVQQRGHLELPAYDQGTDAERAADLVAGQGEERTRVGWGKSVSG